MKIFLSYVIIIGCTVIANLLLKIEADLMVQYGSFWARILSWRLLLGLSLFGCGLLIYTAVLRILPLSVAQSFLAAQFVAVILASRFVLSEQIGSIQWVGTLLIVSGILFVGWSLDS